MIFFQLAVATFWCCSPYLQNELYNLLSQFGMLPISLLLKLKIKVGRDRLTPTRGALAAHRYNIINHLCVSSLQNLEHRRPIIPYHTEKCLVVFTIRWLIQLHDLVSYKAATFLVVVTISDSCKDLGNTTI